jgi:hypothetical protein
VQIGFGRAGWYSWSWLLEAIDGQHTRAVSRLRCRHDPNTLLG